MHNGNDMNYIRKTRNASINLYVTPEHRARLEELRHLLKLGSLSDALEKAIDVAYAKGKTLARQTRIRRVK